MRIQLRRCNFTYVRIHRVHLLEFEEVVVTVCSDLSAPSISSVPPTDLVELPFCCYGNKNSKIKRVTDRVGE